MLDLIELERRANINVYKYREKQVVIYDDHRYLLNVLHFLQEKKFVTDPLDLIYFDYHDDARAPSPAAIEKSKQFRAALPSQRDFFQYVEFDLCPLDNDWLLAGMELNFIKDSILIGAVEKTMMSKYNGCYTDHSGAAHCLYDIPHLWNCLDGRGCLGDITPDKEAQEIRAIMGFNTPDSPRRFTQKVKRPFLLDIDCDVFSMDILGKTAAWPHWRMEELFHKEFPFLVQNTQRFVKELIDRASFITICRESGCCGGIMQAVQIFNNIDRLLFDGELSN